MHVHRGRYDYPDLKKRALALAEQYRPTKLLIEDTGTGSALIQELRRLGRPAIGIKPTTDKVARMSAEFGEVRSRARVLSRTRAMAPRIGGRAVRLSGLTARRSGRFDLASPRTRECRLLGDLYVISKPCGSKGITSWPSRCRKLSVATPSLPAPITPSACACKHVPWPAPPTIGQEQSHRQAAARTNRRGAFSSTLQDVWARLSHPGENPLDSFWRSELQRYERETQPGSGSVEVFLNLGRAGVPRLPHDTDALKVRHKRT